MQEGGSQTMSLFDEHKTHLITNCMTRNHHGGHAGRPRELVRWKISGKYFFPPTTITAGLEHTCVLQPNLRYYGPQ